MSMHWANIGGSTSAQYPSDLIGGVTTTIGSAAFAGRLAAHTYRLRRVNLGVHSATAQTILVKDHAGTATYLTIYVGPVAGSQETTLEYDIKIPIGGISTVCSDTAITATIEFEAEKQP